MSTETKARRTRQIIRIDEDKCDGCGLCVPSCHEGALQIIDGKARLVSEVYCDGLGACLGECPQGALTIEEREAEEFDEAAVKERMAAAKPAPAAPPAPHGAHEAHEHGGHGSGPVGMGGCPGSAVRQFARKPQDAAPRAPGATEESALAQWPIQISLVPPTAPYFQGAELLLAADCVPFAYAGFHRDFLDGRALAIGCPKLDDAEFYRQKLAAIFRDGGVRKVTVLMMEVPCCGGLGLIARAALKLAGKEGAIPLEEIVSGLDGTRRD